MLRLHLPALALLSFLPLLAPAQAPVAHTLRVSGDTLRFRFGKDDMTDVARFSKMDSVDTFNAPQVYDGKVGYWTFASGTESVTVGHDGGKRPNQRVAVTDGQTTKYLQINFWAPLSANFTPAYRKQFGGKVTYEIPEVYELANVAFALTDRGRTDRNMVQHAGAYHARVLHHFGPHASHPLIRRLSAAVKDNYNFYYGTRENAYALRFDPSGRIANGGVYSALWGGPNDIANHAAEWEDFARKSEFRKFYAANQNFYRDDIAEVTRLLPVKKMQDWLEKAFPGIRYDAMKVVFSPLINGSHSAQRFDTPEFRESLMFICDASGLDPKRHTEAEREGLYSGVVFTEIDHNYVNPTSDRHLKAIEAAFGNRATWVKPGDADNYGGAYAVFNEYMTHAVHLLYIKDLYPKAVYDLVRKGRVNMNAGPRGFYRFEAFADELLRLYETRQPGQTVADLYPAILAWAKAVR